MGILKPFGLAFDEGLLWAFWSFQHSAMLLTILYKFLLTIFGKHQGSAEVRELYTLRVCSGLHVAFCVPRNILDVPLIKLCSWSVVPLNSYQLLQASVKLNIGL